MGKLLRLILVLLPEVIKATKEYSYKTWTSHPSRVIATKSGIMRLIAVNPSRRVESVIIIRSSNYSVKFKNKPYRKSVANSRILARVRSCLLVACQRSKSRNDPGTRKRRVRKNTPTFSKESKKWSKSYLILRKLILVRNHKIWNCWILIWKRFRLVGATHLKA